MRRSALPVVLVGLAGVALGVGLPGCRSAPRSSWPSATKITWTTLSTALAERRRGRPRNPWAAALRITMRDPVSGRVVDGRGAIAVSPGRAVRLMLVGAAGATMLDAWVTRERWRIAVPPLDLVRQGGLEEPRDMPVGFLRWWFLTPLTGTLVAAAVLAEGPVWVLREEGAVVELREATCDPGCLRATRRALGHAESVEECRETEAPSAGDSAHYVDEASGLRVELRLESIASQPPSAEAFEDPASAGGSP